MSDIKQINEIAEHSHNDDDLLREQLTVIDFKMVTFSLAGKDYAIDIMRVKEIAKAGNFTYVPNTSPFVLGVYNLRGEIIPIIDLRIFFNIPVPARQRNQVESMVIINVDDQKFGVVVDQIDKVIGISKNSIQPPHPIFGDINIKYIQGVVENSGKLYILLDVFRIFSTRQKREARDTIMEAQNTEIHDLSSPPSVGIGTRNTENLDINFISDTLQAMGKFYASAVNEDWLKTRFEVWQDIRTTGSLQIADAKDAQEFLEGFISPFTGTFWSEAYINSFYKALPENSSKVINVWNIGCGSGYETYSFAVLLKLKYPNSRIRIYANDSDLLSISNATMLTFPDEQINSIYQRFLVQGVDGSYSFNTEIKDSILFEYHDCAHQNIVPDADIILARDVLSLVPTEVQEYLINEFEEKLKPTGIIFLGKNECMPKQSGWARFNEGDIVFFSKE